MKAATRKYLVAFHKAANCVVYWMDMLHSTEYKQKIDKCPLIVILADFSL